MEIYLERVAFLVLIPIALLGRKKGPTQNEIIARCDVCTLPPLVRCCTIFDLNGIMHTAKPSYEFKMSRWMDGCGTGEAKQQMNSAYNFSTGTMGLIARGKSNYEQFFFWLLLLSTMVHANRRDLRG